MREAAAAATAAGARVLGYVPTAWGARPAADVEADIERYRGWYGVDGIFLDEAAADPASLPYYAALRRALAGRFLVLNPGIVPARQLLRDRRRRGHLRGSGRRVRGRAGPGWLGRIAPGASRT